MDNLQMPRPSLISIDTSIFGKIAKDYFSRDAKRKQCASQVIDRINDSGYCPFFSFPHIQEILQHNNRGIVSNRWLLIKQFKTVAWLSSYGHENILGSPIDCHKLEVKLFSESGVPHADYLRESIWKRLVKYCSGKDFVEKFQNIYMQLRELGEVDVNRNKEVESLSHIQDSRVNALRLKELSNYKLRSVQDLKNYLQSTHCVRKAALMERGDKSLKEIGKVAQGFTSLVAQLAAPLFSSENSNLYEAFVLNSGVRLDQVTPNTKVGELGYLSVFNRQSEIVVESLMLPPETVQKLTPEESVIWTIWRFLDEAMKNEKRAHGSNVIDRDLSVLAICVDLFTVDKRVKEYLRQLSLKNPEVSKSFGTIVKLSDYSQLLESLSRKDSPGCLK